MSFLRHWRFLLLALLPVAMLAVFSACSSSSENNPSGSAGASGSGGAIPSGPPSDLAPDSQQTLSVNIRAEPSSIDPQAQSYTYEATVVKNTYATLLDEDPATGQLVPTAAAEVPTQANGGISADGLTYTIKLKPGLKFSDGTPVTAKDFVYGIIRGYNLNVSGTGYGGFITAIKGAPDALKLDATSATYVQDVQNLLKDSVVAVDDTTLKIVLGKVSVSFPYNLTLPITAAVKQSNVEALGDKFGQASGAAQMITSGPFVVTEWAAKDHLTMVRNDNYTAAHKAYLKTLTAKFIEDDTQTYNAFQAGQLGESQVPAANFSGIKDDPRVKQEQEFGVRWITVDVTLEPWNKPDFVIGINQATDRATIANDVYAGTRLPYHAFCAPAVVGCDPSKFDSLDYNLDKAKASIAKAYPNGNIPPITLEITNDPTVKSLATTLQSEWQQIGVTTNIVPTDQKTIRADMKAHKSGMQITGWQMDFSDPYDVFSIRTTAQLGTNNFGFYSRPDYDKLVDDMDKALDATKRTQLVGQLQDYLASNPPDIYFTINLKPNIFKAGVKGLYASSLDYEVYADSHMSEWYISK